MTLLSISPSKKWGFQAYVSNGVKIVESPDLLPGLGRSGWDAWDTLNRILYLDGNRHQFDLVHGCESRPAVALPALYLKYKCGIPTVLDWADWYGRGGTARERGSSVLQFIMEPVETFCEEVFHPLADGCVAMGEPLFRRAISVDIPCNRILNLLHGCDPDCLIPIRIQEARRKLLRIPKEGLILGYLGVLRQSCARLLFEVLQLITKKMASCKLILIGNHKLELRDHLPACCKENVIETGWVSYEELNLYLAASDLLLLPFVRTTATDNIWPSKLNDYMAAGRPTVATRMHVLEPIFQKYQVGLLTEDNPQDFVEGCLHLLENRSACRQIGRNARALAEGDLSWSHLVERLEEFYFCLIKA